MAQFCAWMFVCGEEWRHEADAGGRRGASSFISVVYLLSFCLFAFFLFSLFSPWAVAARLYADMTANL
jgi:hypothetical protein